MGVLLVIFPFTTYIAPESHRKNKPSPLSLTSTTSHPNFPAPLFHLDDHHNRTSPPHFSGGLPDAPLDHTLLNRRRRPSPQNIPAETPNHTLIQRAFLEPLLLRSRPAHRSRFADAFVLRAGSSSPVAPEPLHRRRRARTGSASPSLPCMSLRII